MSRPGGGKGSFFWEASPSTYPLIGKSRDLLPTGRDRTANLWAPDCKSYLFFAREVYEASLHWGDSDLLNSTTTTCTQSNTSKKKKETINTRKEVFFFLEAKRPSRAIVKLSSSSCRARLYSRYSRGKLARYSC